MITDCPSLLISDDDRGFRETLAGAFEERGFRTLIAADGSEAVNLIRSEEVHLVLLDMHMPRLTGLEALRQMRVVQADLPCILISGAVDDEILSQAEAQDVFSVLSKPVQFRHVTATVRQALSAAYGWDT